MKKIFLVLMMALLLASCAEWDIGHTLSMNPLVMQPIMPESTKAPVTGGTFPDQSFVVSASVDGTTFFQGITFSKNGTVWKASPTKYWPQTGTSAFLAYSCPGLSVATTWNSNAASGYTLARSGNANTIPDNRTVQSDIMYAGVGGQTQHSGGVSLGFKHAQALLKFTGQAYASYNSTANTGVTIESIVINSLKYQGKLDVTLSGSTVSASWTLQSATGSATAASGSWGLPQSGTVDIGSGYMVIPQTAVSFTINYTVHKGGSNTSKSHTHTPSGSWEMGQAYNYAIYIDKDETEIRVAPSLIDWSNAGTSNVSIEYEQLAYATFGGLMIAPSNCYLTGASQGNQGVAMHNDWNHDSYSYIWSGAGAFYRSATSWKNAVNSAPVSFGGFNDWRIPTGSEWNTILGTGRNGSTVNGTSSCKYALVQLTGVLHATSTTPLGLLLFPDNLIISGKTLSGVNNGTITYGMTEAELNEYLSYGCAFLPASGFWHSNNSSWRKGGTGIFLIAQDGQDGNRGSILEAESSYGPTVNSDYIYSWLDACLRLIRTK